MIIAVTVRIMKIVDGRKGDFMRATVLKRMEQEVKEYRQQLVSGRMTAEQIVEQSYQLVVKQGLYYVFANHNAGKLSEDEWSWINCQEHIVDYLYELWMGNDTDLTEEFAEIIYKEVNLDMEEHTNE